MQFLWKYVDDLIGKGIDTTVLVELLVYATAQFIPGVLPLAILLASIMTVGSFSEHFELTAVKAAGIPLRRYWASLTVVAILVSIGALLFANYAMPFANLKFHSLLYDIRSQSPALNFEPGVFNNSMENVSIKTDAKDGDGKTLYGLKIYDNTHDVAGKNVLVAEEGQLIQPEGEVVMTMLLKNGVQYRGQTKKPQEKELYKHYTIEFDTWERKFDMSEFSFERTDEEMFKTHRRMFNIQQLIKEIDTNQMNIVQRIESLTLSVDPYAHFLADEVDSGFSWVVYQDTLMDSITTFFDTVSLQNMPSDAAKKVLLNTAANIRNTKNFIRLAERDLASKKRDHVLFQKEIYLKLVYALACLVMFFIGAPLGAVVKKGGFGMPVAISIAFFVVFHVTNMLGQSITDQNVIPPYIAMFLPIFVLTPIAVYLVIAARNDKGAMESFKLKPLLDLIKRLKPSEKQA